MSDPVLLKSKLFDCYDLAQKGDAQAQFTLALMYAKGDGVPQDGIEALKWCRKAAENGHVKAQFNLGLIYRDQGDVMAAIAQFRRAVAANPLDRDARRLLERMQRIAGEGARQQISPHGGEDDG